jgi:integrase
MNLTDLKLRSLPFEDCQREYPDDAVPGMYIRVGKKTKTFMLTIRLPIRRRVTIGRYDPPHFTLSMARERARDLLAEARVAKDQPAAMTFEAALELFKTTHIPTMRPGSQEQARRILSKRFTALARRRLTEIKTSELAATIDVITAPGEKLNAFIYLRAFLNWCYQRGYIDINPISRLKAPAASRIREHVLSDEDLIRVWTTVSADSFSAFIRLLILTAQRKGQWYAFKPEFIQGETIVFPAEVMKAGKTHVIPITSIIARTIGDHCFTGFSEGRRKRELMKLSQTSGWTLHDLRRTTSTRMAEQGVAPHVIERLLAHSMPGVTARYNRASYIPEMRDALKKWENHLQALLSTMEGRNGGDLRDVHCLRA